jgi:hypothetical protein
MSASAYDDVHRAANFALVPWTIRLLEGEARPPINDRRMARLLEPDALTAEARERIVEVLPKGALRFLVYAGGWRAVSIPAGGGERIDARARLSEAGVWRSFTLSFSACSFRALIEAFCVEFCDPDSRQAKDSGAEMAGEWASGDLIVAHAIGRYLDRAELSAYARLGHNPLTAVCADGGLRAAEDDCAAVFEHLEPVLPWLAFHIGQRWRARIDQLTSDARDFERGARRLAGAVGHWRREAVGRQRPDLLRAAVVAAAELFGTDVRAELLERRLEEIFGSLRFVDRQPSYDALAEPLRELLEARSVYEQCRATPPIDRSAASTIFMRDCEAADAAPMWRRLEGFIDRLEGRVG